MSRGWPLGRANRRRAVTGGIPKERTQTSLGLEWGLRVGCGGRGCESPSGPGRGQDRGDGRSGGVRAVLAGAAQLTRAAAPARKVRGAGCRRGGRSPAGSSPVPAAPPGPECEPRRSRHATATLATGATQGVWGEKQWSWRSARPAPPAPRAPSLPPGKAWGLGATARGSSVFSRLRRYSGRSSEPRPAPPRRVLAPSPPSGRGPDLGRTRAQKGFGDWAGRSQDRAGSEKRSMKVLE